MESVTNQVSRRVFLTGPVLELLYSKMQSRPGDCEKGRPRICEETAHSAISAAPAGLSPLIAPTFRHDDAAPCSRPVVHIHHKDRELCPSVQFPGHRTPERAHSPPRSYVTLLPPTPAPVGSLHGDRWRFSVPFGMLGANVTAHNPTFPCARPIPHKNATVRFYSSYCSLVGLSRPPLRPPPSRVPRRPR